jgi:1,2-diacylglycerol 3-alpha-glucosyltransferase
MPGIGVDTDWYSPSSVEPGNVARVRQEMRVEPGAPLLVAVGELNRNKRMADIIEALARMRHREAVLMVAGSGAERGRLEALAAECGVRDRVHLAGQVDDIRPVVGGATALVLASGREGLARSIMEALALEVPVIASTARGNGELVGADRRFIFQIGDVNALAARMDWLVDHPAEGLAMGRRGRQRMVERFDERSLIRLHEEMYGDMLAARGWRGS